MIRILLGLALLVAAAPGTVLAVSSAPAAIGRATPAPAPDPTPGPSAAPDPAARRLQRQIGIFEKVIDQTLIDSQHALVSGGPMAPRIRYGTRSRAVSISTGG